MLSILHDLPDDEYVDSLMLSGSPLDVREHDFVAGYEVVSVAAGQHDGAPARLIRLADEYGKREVGMLRIRVDAEHDAQLEFVRVFDTPEDKERFKERYSKPVPTGYRPVKARQVDEGQWVADPDIGVHESVLVGQVVLKPLDDDEAQGFGCPSGIAVWFHEDDGTRWLLDPFDAEATVWVKDGDDL